jgi:hypothetical protein
VALVVGERLWHRLAERRDVRIAGLFAEGGPGASLDWAYLCLVVELERMEPGLLGEA